MSASVDKVLLLSTETQDCQYTCTTEIFPIRRKTLLNQSIRDMALERLG